MFSGHFSALPPRRILGSRYAKAMSDRNIPTTVSSAKNIKNDPAKYISWLCYAEINIGPVVGRDSTIETIAEPETI